MIDHNVLSRSCAKKTATAIFTSFRENPFCQTKNKAMPIKTNNVVHTGPKIQFGGEKLGLMMPAYQVGIDWTVKIEPMIPASSETKMANTSLIDVFKFMSQLYRIQ